VTPSTQLYWYAIAVVLLFVKMFLTSALQGYVRLRTLTFKNAEDAAVFRKPAAESELANVQKAGQCWQNDLENIPLFFCLGGLYVAVAASPEWARTLFLTFVAARYAHTFFYMLRIQPWRFLSYATGMIVMGTMAVCIVTALHP
jgi:uncharacterized MAPEG superfamily protein